MRRDKISAEKKRKGNITRDVLLNILKTGAILGIALMAPNALKILRNFGKEDVWNGFYPSSIERLTGNLYRKGFVKIKYVKGQPIVILTDKGRVEILKYDLSKLEITPMKRWDNKWRLVIFDIPEIEKYAREFIRKKLQEMNFFQFQKSVFINPYPCEKEIKYIREVLEVPHAIKLLRADRIENEKELKEIFHLT